MLWHASIRTTANVYIQPIPASRVGYQLTDKSDLSNTEPGRFFQNSHHNGPKRFQVRRRGQCKCLKELAPQVGLEPATLRLTAGLGEGRFQ
jgi:hypothetical protein